MTGLISLWYQQRNKEHTKEKGKSLQKLVLGKIYKKERKEGRKEKRKKEEDKLKSKCREWGVGMRMEWDWDQWLQTWISGGLEPGGMDKTQKGEVAVQSYLSVLRKG